MYFDFTGAEQFLSYLAGDIPLAQVLTHPAYQTVWQHARQFGTRLTAQNVVAALAGQPSSFYGLNAVSANLPRIQALLATLRAQATAWSITAAAELHALWPEADLDFPIYPIIGYDMGIGLQGAVCMNCNCPAYLDDPSEMLYYLIHEATHVLYERAHEIPPLAAVNAPAEWRAYFNLWFHNEGYAVYTPLRLRTQQGALQERDYRVLNASTQMAAQQATYWRTVARLASSTPLAREEYLELCFGPARLTYRLGCELLRRLEQSAGLAAVQEAFWLPAEMFSAQYQALLAQ